MAYTNTELAQQTYVAYFNRPADVGGLDFYLPLLDKNVIDQAAMSADLSKSKEFVDAFAGMGPQAIIGKIYNNLFGHDPDQGGLKFYATALANKVVTLSQIVKMIADGANNADGTRNADGIAFDNKVKAAIAFTNELTVEGNAGANIAYSTGTPAVVEIAKGYIASVTTDASAAAAIAGVHQTTLDLVSANTPSTKVDLTTGVDTLVGKLGNDVFNANSVLVGGAYQATLTGLDSIDGGAGNDTLNVVDVNAISVPTSVTVKNVENINLTSSKSVNGDISGWTGVNKVNVTAIGDELKLVTDPATAQALTVGAADVNFVNSASSVANAAAAVATPPAVIKTGAITVSGGKSVSITNKVTNTTVATDASAGNVYGTVQGGDITVSGGAATTNVTVTQNAAVTASQTKSGVANSAVVINDLNAGSQTKAATIKSVSLENFSSGAKISSNALTDLTLAGKGGNVDLTSGLTTETVTALNLNLNGATVGTIEDKSNHFKTINVKTGVGAATVANIKDTAATALNISGDKALTLTSVAGLTTLDKVTVAGAGGVTMSAGTATDVNASASTGKNVITLDATATTFTGGSGVDVVVIDKAPTKALAGGAGTADELLLNAATGAIGSLSTNTKVTGFEVVGVTTGASGNYDVAGFAGLHVAGATNADVVFSNVGANVGLTIDGSLTKNVGYVLKDATGTADSITVTVGSATTSGVDAATNGKLDITGIETLKVSSLGDATAANKLAVVDTTATTSVLKSIVITGANDVTLSANLTGAASITSIDASAATGAIDTTGVAVAAAGANIKGSATAANKLAGGAGADTIVGGAKADTISSGAGLDIVTGGAGADKFVLTSNANGNVYTTITDFTKGTGGDSLDLTALSVGSISDATLGAKITLGATAAFADFLAAAATGHATAATNAVVTWFQFNNDTYIVVDNTNADVFTNGAVVTVGGVTTGGDQVVKLTGLIDLKGAAIASEILTAA